LPLDSAKIIKSADYSKWITLGQDMLGALGGIEKHVK
jgi:hypothetical protein